MSYNICLMPGDGIGPEVLESAVKVLKALDMDLRFVKAEIGYDCYKKRGVSLPDKTLETIKACDSALFAAVTTPPNIPNYKSPIVRLRKELNLYVNLRPNKSYPVEGFKEEMDIVIFRENTEGLYVQVERV